MSIYLHTICLEPRRWSTPRVSRPLIELLPGIAESGFRELEIFEPHLAEAPDAAALARRCRELGLTPVILSSYLNLHPGVTSDEQLQGEFDVLARRIEAVGFTGLRLFPAPTMAPDDLPGIAGFTERLDRLARRLPGVDVLLETHDGSLADHPGLLVSILETLGRSNVGLLYQPTVFSAAAAVAQMQVQQKFVRHIHLQNRHADLSFATLAEGVVSWSAVLAALGRSVPMSLEFVPVGICPVEQFDLEATLRQARREADGIVNPRP